MEYFSKYLRQPEIWIPHYPTLQESVFSSQFGGIGYQSDEELNNITEEEYNKLFNNNNNDDNSKDNSTNAVYTFVSTNNNNLTDIGQIIIPYPPYMYYFYDIYNGIKLVPIGVPRLLGNNTSSPFWNIWSQLNFTIEGNFGYGGIYVCLVGEPSCASNGLSSYLNYIKSKTITSLSSYSSDTTYIPQSILPTIPTKPTLDPPPKDMIFINGTGEELYWFNVTGIEIEGDDVTPGVDVQYNIFGETQPMKNHSLLININSFYIDQYPVTNFQYYLYLLDNGFPSNINNTVSCYNYLKDWNWSNITSIYNCSTPYNCNCNKLQSLNIYPQPDKLTYSSPVTWISYGSPNIL